MTYHNTYYALRHGISTANEQQLVVSDPDNGVSSYGLSEAGISDSKKKFELLKSKVPFEKTAVVCITSDFARAKETAELFCEVFSLEKPIIDQRLRERFFGDFELQSSENYHKIWAFDENSADHTEFGCESSHSVATRIRALITNLEEKYQGQSLVLVSHGDTLQITQTVFKGIAPNLHRSLPHLNNAELRRLN